MTRSLEVLAIWKDQMNEPNQQQLAPAGGGGALRKAEMVDGSYSITEREAEAALAG